jgi:phage recombination protein Bet
MATDTALVGRTSAVDPEIAASMQIYDRLEPLKNALGIQDLSVPEMQLFAMVAHRTGLDPFTRQIYAIKRGGKVTHQTGIDGYRSVAERTQGYAGSDEPTYETPCPCGQKPDGHPAVARVTVHRLLPGGHVVDQVGVARWHELVPTSGQDSMWLKMPFNQLSKCAEANALRKAFPRVLEGVYVTEEMEQAGPAQNGPLAEAAGRPTAADRLAARRHAIEQQAAADPTVIEGTATEVDDLPAAEIRPQTGDPGPTPPTPTPPPPAAAARAAAPQARKSRVLTFEEFNAGVRSLEATPEDVVEGCRQLFPDAKRISGLTGEQRDHLLGRIAELVEARQAASASQ